MWADHDVINDALEPADDVRQHGRPREFPDCGAQRPFYDRAIVAWSRWTQWVKAAVDEGSVSADAGVSVNAVDGFE